MKMPSAIAFTILAGGPGSGCRGPHCGRPHSIEPGDVVKLNKDVKFFNTKTSNFDLVKAGSKVVVVNVLHKVNEDHMISVKPKLSKYGDAEYVKMSDVTLHRPGNTDQVEEIKPVPKSQVIVKTTTSDGADLTVVRPVEEQEKDPKTLADIAQEAHYLKGRFARLETVPGLQDRPGYKRVTRIYDVQGLPSHFHVGAGATVWVSKYTRGGKTKEIVIQEQNYTTYGIKTRGIMEWRYKNTGKALGMLKQRYGISYKLGRF